MGQLTENERIELGAFCGGLLADPQFTILCEQFEKSYCHQLLATKPDQSSERERIYATYNGAQTFIGFINSIFQQAEALSKANDPELADEYEGDDEEAIDY